MLNSLINLFQPALLKMDAEEAHSFGLKALSALPIPFKCRDDKLLAVNAFGFSFDNPIGVAAGLDKNAIAAHNLLKIGFGFVEVGTLTPQPQTGNPKPRIFRLSEDLGVINRLGFNNEGFQGAAPRISCLSKQLGVNIGANKDTIDRAADYVAGIKFFAQHAKYFTVNISSPNTPNLRDLQNARSLDELLKRVMDERAEACPSTPVLLKIAPDLHLSDLDDVVKIALKHELSGLIVSNTTITRPTLLSSNQLETGGLSGKPVFELSTKMLAETYQRVEGKVPLIGVGGIHDTKSAIAKLEAGATLIQVYSALVYKGLPLIDEIKKGILSHLQTHKTTLPLLTGSKYKDWLF